MNTLSKFYKRLENCSLVKEKTLYFKNLLDKKRDIEKKMKENHISKKYTKITKKDF